MNKAIIHFLDGKSEKTGSYVIWGFLILIYGTILLLVIEEVYPYFYQSHYEVFTILEFIILFFLR